jgi:tyrosyl-tRNA synthetase
MSKSLGNYIGVTDDPEEMFGKVMRIPDGNIQEYQALLLGGESWPDEPPNLAKRRLASSLVDRFHGKGSGAEAEAAFNRVFVDHEAPEEIDLYVLEGTAAVHLPAVLADAFGVSRSEARRVVAQGGVRRDGEVLPPEKLDYPVAELNGCVIQMGKRRFRRFETQS